MARVKGKYVAQITVKLDFDKDEHGILPFDKLERAVKCDFTNELRKIIYREFLDERMGSVTVVQQYADLYLENDED